MSYEQKKWRASRERIKIAKERGMANLTTPEINHLLEREARIPQAMNATDSVRLIEVIQTTLTRRGEGKSENDPVRIITQYWSLDGTLLAEVDPWLQGKGKP